MAPDGERLIHTFDKPRPDGARQFTLTPLELLDRLARFIPPPRRHMPRYHGAFAPHSALRAQVSARAGQVILAPSEVASAASSAEYLMDVIHEPLDVPVHALQAPPEPIIAAPPGARTWARLMARIHEVDPLRCRRCGGTMVLIAFIVGRAVIVRILARLDEPSRAPRMAPIRGTGRSLCTIRFDTDMPEKR